MMIICMKVMYADDLWVLWYHWTIYHNYYSIGGLGYGASMFANMVVVFRK